MCCHRTRVHVQVVPREHCGIDICPIAFEVRGVVAVDVRTGVDVTFERSVLLMPWEV
jgi:hypothetical protein